jgi:polygalacturonase
LYRGQHGAKVCPRKEDFLLKSHLFLLAPLALAACGNAAKIESARAGSTVKLSGDQGVVTLSGKSWSPAITVDASNATFTGIVLTNVTGIHFKGGNIIGPGGKSYGIRITQSRDVAVDGMVITGSSRGIVMDRSQDVAVRNTELTGLRSDGIDISSSQRVVIDRNRCSKFNPVLATFDANGVKTDGDHPDCIQGWSRGPNPPTSDVTVTNNSIDGTMQGIFFRSTPANGGFDRITIRDNVLRTGMSNAIYIQGARSAVVRGNRITSLPGAVQIKSGRQVKANLVIRDSTVDSCGNQVADVPFAPGTGPCR